jgi:DNA-binding transcriptional ArsR family regulator
METKAYEMKAEILRVLAQPTRMKILECLRNGERSIHEIIPDIHVNELS